ncbi:MAG: rhomboid family intramembrane serine protease [Bacteroidales bacterium]|nr:rhomboid family intramembrane serine protease [Clostridium sp.]MCM1203983.1 rhomboid family intramembrane serine protease [Bacteroidales bacterium]
MLRQIVTLLYQKGYAPLEEAEGGVLVRDTDQTVYVVLLSRFREDVRIIQYQNADIRIEFKVAAKYRKPVRILHLLAVENGIFEDEVLAFVERLSNVWLVAEDTGRIYVFENQPQQFDDLYKYLDEGVQRPGKSYQRAGLFVLTPVNVIIVIVNIICFLLVILINGGYYAVYDMEIMLKMGALSYDTFMQGAWYQIVTSIFLHFGLSHLLNNMLLLFYAGCELERRIGSFPYFVLYFLSGICGNIVSLVYYHDIGEKAVSAGASGAIFGIIGALMVVLVGKDTKTENLTPVRLFFLAVLTIHYGITTTGVDNAAHIGGLLSGIIGGFLLSKISQYGKLE